MLGGRSTSTLAADEVSMSNPGRWSGLEEEETEAPSGHQSTLPWAQTQNESCDREGPQTPERCALHDQALELTRDMDTHNPSSLEVGVFWSCFGLELKP